MTHIPHRRRVSHDCRYNIQPILDRVSAGVLRYSLVLIFMSFRQFKLGAALWTAGETLRASLTARESSRGESCLHKAI